jgi:hypothetical protein
MVRGTGCYPSLDTTVGVSFQAGTRRHRLKMVVGRVNDARARKVSPVRKAGENNKGTRASICAVSACCPAQALNPFNNTTAGTPLSHKHM